MGHKENIIELLKENELGLTYKVLYSKYEKKFGFKLSNEEKNGYYYLKVLIDKGLVKTYIPEDRKGKIVAYKLTEKALNQEPDHSDITLTDKVVEVLVKSGAKSEDYGVEISEKEIMPSIKRLMESGRIG